jgi:hypothetical protein
MSSNDAIPRDRVMPLHGAEALPLYLKIIGRNITAMKRQTDLLRTALANMRASLNELGERSHGRNERPRQVGSTETG